MDVQWPKQQPHSEATAEPIEGSEHETDQTPAEIEEAKRTEAAADVLGDVEERTQTDETRNDEDLEPPADRARWHVERDVLAGQGRVSRLRPLGVPPSLALPHPLVS